jgi:hypothetical protein
LGIGYHKEEVSGDTMPVEMVALESKAIGWLQENLDLFNPLRDSDIESIIDDLKAMCELLFLCSLRHKKSYGHLPQVYEYIVSFLYENVFKTRAYQELIQRRPDTVLHMLAYVSFRICGYEDTFYRQRLERLFEKRYVCQVERLPYRNMDLSLMLEKGGFAVAYQKPEDFFKDTLLAQHPDIYFLNENDVYAITHAIFYYTDFNQRGSEFAPADLDYMNGALPYLLAFYVRKRNWDLVGELLICMFLVSIHNREHANELYKLGWSCLQEAQHKDGWVAGPLFSMEAYVKCEAKGKREYLFKKNYHTTIVALIASIVCDDEQ